MKLMTNNPKKRTGLIGYGLEITEICSLEISANQYNQKYLETKRDKMGHTLKLEKGKS
jgi:3,4-dihydroxy 2-butanone 4-phosphate synthase/GTP cyclohydrolase II